MHRFQLLVGLFFFVITLTQAQSGCPGCTVNVPAGLPADTVYLPALPDGEQGVAYDQNISFRLPLTTTPVAVLDTTIPPGLPISKFEIVALEGLPAGLSWEPNQFIFQTAVQTDGCIRLCGTPLASDSFILTVRLKATVLFFTQESSFPLRLYIAPQVSMTDGFSMTNFEGCGETTVTFTNNIPSNGAPGFTYSWDFGDGTTFTGENPPPHTYTGQGMYPVQYQATIDTVGYVLNGFTVLNVECTDPLNGPDLYLRLYGPSGNLLLNTSPAVNNTPLPWNVPADFILGNGNYTVNVTDEDTGIKGTDDPCGAVSFNYLSNDTLVAGGFRIVVHIEHPVYEVNSVDTVKVFFQPPVPTVNAPQGFTACADADPIVLVSSFGAGNHWWYNGEMIPGASNFIYEPDSNGYYQVQLLTPDGCSSISDSVWVEYFPIPADPQIIAIGGELEGCLNGGPITLTSTYASGNQWLRNGVEIANATDQTYSADEEGYYHLFYTSPEGCSAESDSAHVTFVAPPAAPVFTNTNNFLRLTDTLALPSMYLLQWFNATGPIVGANGFTLCATASDNYELQVLDLSTGCQNSFDLDVALDPNFDCTVGTAAVGLASIRLYPNPVYDFLSIQVPDDAQLRLLRIWSSDGRLVRTKKLSTIASTLQVDFQDQAAGLYLLELLASNGERFSAKVQVLH